MPPACVAMCVYMCVVCGHGRMQLVASVRGRGSALVGGWRPAIAGVSVASCIVRQVFTVEVMDWRWFIGALGGVSAAVVRFTT